LSVWINFYTVSEKEEQKIDWIHLPNNVQETSLWICLHDGELVSCTSNLLECFVTLKFRVDFLFDDDDELASFLLKLEDVTSVRAIVHYRWVGKFEDRENISREEREQLVQQYWAKWRDESLSWSEFEEALETDPLQISDASYASKNNETALKIGGFLNGEKFDGIYFDVFLRGKNLSVSRSDGKEFSLEKFIELGRKYWNSLGSK
jgi:hypothetical protein